MIDRYKNYADYYDKGTTTDISATVDIIKRVIKKNNPSARSLLELASGTGNVVELLQDEYEVSGIDLSPAMLRIAQKKLPNIEMYLADMTSFDLNEKYDVIICVFDSVNHLIEFEDWKRLFDRVKEHLSKSGVFLMDCNTVAKLEKYTTLRPSRRDFIGGYQIAKITKDNNGIYHFVLNVHKEVGDGSFEISKNDIPEAAFPIKQIESALYGRFKNVNIFNIDGAVASESDHRVYFSCNNL